MPRISINSQWSAAFGNNFICAQSDVICFKQPLRSGIQRQYNLFNKSKLTTLFVILRLESNHFVILMLLPPRYILGSCVRVMGIVIEQSGSSPYLGARCENIFIRNMDNLRLKRWWLNSCLMLTKHSEWCLHHHITGLYKTSDDWMVLLWWNKTKSLIGPLSLSQLWMRVDVWVLRNNQPLLHM